MTLRNKPSVRLTCVYPPFGTLGCSPHLRLRQPILVDLSATSDCGISMSHGREFGMTVAPGIAALYSVPHVLAGYRAGWPCSADRLRLAAFSLASWPLPLRALCAAR